MILLSLLCVGAVLSRNVSASPYNSIPNAKTPKDALEAIQLFNRAVIRGEVLQSQRALYWMKHEFAAVLRHPELEKMNTAAVLQLLGQPFYVDEIDVFRAVRRLVALSDPCPQPADSDTCKIARHPKNALLASVRLAAINPHQLRAEVVPSNLYSLTTIMDVLFHLTSGNALPIEYLRAETDALAAISEKDIIKSQFGVRVEGAYDIAPGCRGGGNPLLESNVTSDSYDPYCFVTSKDATPIVVDFRRRFFINRVETRIPGNYKCSNLVIEGKVGQTWYQIKSVQTAYAKDTISFPSQGYSQIRYKSGQCVDSSNGSRLPGTILSALTAYFYRQ